MKAKHGIYKAVLGCLLVVLACDTPDNPVFGPGNPDPNPTGTAPPTLSSIDPPAAFPIEGTVVTIAGSGFNSDPSFNLVNFGTKVGTVVSVTASALDVEIPALAGVVDVRVAVKGAEEWSNTLPFEFKSFIPVIDNPDIAIIDDTTLYPKGIAVDDDDNIYIGSGDDGVIYKIAPDGTKSEFASGLNPQAAMHFGPDGYLYVCSGGGNGDGTVSRVSPDGSSVELVAQDVGGLDVDWDENGNMYITGGGTIYRIAAGESAPVAVASDISALRNCRVFDGYLYVSQVWEGQISRFEITGDGLGDQEVYAEVDTPVSFDFDENGTLYWAFAWASGVHAYAPGGAEEAVLYEEIPGIPERLRYMLFHKDRIYVVWPGNGGGNTGVAASVFIGINQAPRYGR